ncbi:pre-mRNA-splicing factor ISY1 homolog [Tubulanus polymorphus]|uniref:pre-mRNA-splicing factor ISY1 homolog n=1 Tax=Tubulanus polymorphus TaxID=672921 RepID=UPI003DA4D04D
MARNSEKAMTTLARWRAAHIDKVNEQTRRPYLASECDDLTQCEKWRRQIIGEISRKVAQIQNAGLGEFKLRDLNDEINKLLREKRHWEDRIIELHGPNYKRIGPKMLDSEGREVPGNRGYKYFGAAKDLPGVRELFEQAPPPAPRKTRSELMKEVSADYYGYRDEEDGVLIPLEKQMEKEVVANLVAKWKAKKESDQVAPVSEEKNEDDDDDIYAVDAVKETDGEPVAMETEEVETNFIAHVPVPSQKDVEEALVRRKKMELLERYASDVLKSDSEDTRKLLGLTTPE